MTPTKAAAGSFFLTPTLPHCLCGLIPFSPDRREPAVQFLSLRHRLHPFPRRAPLIRDKSNAAEEFKITLNPTTPHHPEARSFGVRRQMNLQRRLAILRIPVRVFCFAPRIIPGRFLPHPRGFVAA